MKKRVVVSAVSFTEGGPLTILNSCLSSFKKQFGETWEMTALVHNASLVNVEGIEFLEFPLAKRSWLARLYYEWWAFSALSKQLKPDLWLSLHDITPRVHTSRQAVYCHNPSPFYRLPWQEAWMDKRLFVFSLLYKWVYGLGIRKNKMVIVQQSWMREAFHQMYGNLPVLVAHPELDDAKQELQSATIQNQNFVFFYPALPRVFKNYEVIAQAVELLLTRSISNFEVRFTAHPDENEYTAWIAGNYSSPQHIVWLGRQTVEQMRQQYQEASAVIFASKLETWGLPITEAKCYGKPLIVANRNYARETIGQYHNAALFDADSPDSLADQMQKLIEGSWEPQVLTEVIPEAPYARGWDALWKTLLAL